MFYVPTHRRESFERQAKLTNAEHMFVRTSIMGTPSLEGLTNGHQVKGSSNF